jgi:hypothetical protein
MHAPEEQAVDSIRTRADGSVAVDQPDEVFSSAVAIGFVLGEVGLVAS